MAASHSPSSAESCPGAGTWQVTHKKAASQVKNISNTFTGTGVGNNEPEVDGQRVRTKILGLLNNYFF